MSALIDGMMMMISTPVGDNGINMSATISYPPPVYTYVYNSAGIAISRTLTDGSDIMEVYILETPPGTSIPFGMYFLVFLSIAMAALVIIVKKRHMLVKR